MGLTLDQKRAMLAENGTACCLNEWSMCLLPDEPLTLTPSDDTYATVEHLIPRADGGSNAPVNIKLSHKLCNRVRGRTPLPGLQLPQSASKRPVLTRANKPRRPLEEMTPFTSEWLKAKGYMEP